MVSPRRSSNRQEKRHAHQRSVVASKLGGGSGVGRVVGWQRPAYCTVAAVVFCEQVVVGKDTKLLIRATKLRTDERRNDIRGGRERAQNAASAAQDRRGGRLLVIFRCVDARVQRRRSQ